MGKAFGPVESDARRGYEKKRYVASSRRRSSDHVQTKVVAKHVWNRPGCFQLERPVSGFAAGDRIEDFLERLSRHQFCGRREQIDGGILTV